MPIRDLPPAPSRQDPDGFDVAADALLSALAGFVSDANSLEQSLQLVATTGTSTTSNTIGTGSKGFVTQPGKAWVVGAYVYVCSAASVANLLYGQINAYNTTTGVMTVNVTAAVGSGTYANWVIGLSVPANGSLSITRLDATDYVVAKQLLQVRDAGTSGFISILPGDTTHTGYIGLYDASGAQLGYAGWGTASRIYMYSYGSRYYEFNEAPQCLVDAATANALVRKSQVDTATAGLAVGGFSGLALSASGASASVSVSADRLVVIDASNQSRLLAPSLTINTASSGANGLDTGSLAANTWYAVWVIYNPTTSTAAGLVSLSSNSPTMPSGYGFKARVGWIRTDGTANKYPLAFKQVGRRVQYVVNPSANVPSQPVIVSGVQGTVSTGVWVAAGVGAYVPATAGRLLGAVANGVGAAGTTMAHPNGNAGAYSSMTNPPMVSVSIGVASRTVLPFDMVLESTNIYYAADQSDSKLYCIGWEDNL